MVHVGIGYDVHQLVVGRKLILGTNDAAATFLKGQRVFLPLDKSRLRN